MTEHPVPGTDGRLARLLDDDGRHVGYVIVSATGGYGAVYSNKPAALAALAKRESK